MSLCPKPFVARGPENDGQKKNKRQKVCRERSLLERARDAGYWEHLKTPEDCECLMDEVLQHTSEFPVKVQRGIAIAKEMAENNVEPEVEWDNILPPWYFEYLFPELIGLQSKTPAQRFCAFVTCVISQFIFGWPIHDNLRYDEEDDTGNNSGWNGPDRDVDTEDEIELALRLFPNVLRHERRIDPTDTDDHNVLFFLATKIESISFIPLFADLCRDFDMSDVVCPFAHVVDLPYELLHNTCSVRRFSLLSYNDYRNELQEESDAVLVNLMEEDLIFVDRLYPGSFFPLHMTYEKFLDNTLDLFPDDYIKSRLSLLIEMEPEKLHPGDDPEFWDWDYSSEFFRHFRSGKRGEFVDEVGRVDIRFFEFIWDMGMFHYPDELLGFALHGRNFREYHAKYGEEAREAINKRIQRAVAQDMDESGTHDKANKLHDMVIEAATNDMIFLDGLYSLIRIDPEMALRGAIKQNHQDLVIRAATDEVISLEDVYNLIRFDPVAALRGTMKQDE